MIRGVPIYNIVLLIIDGPEFSAVFVSRVSELGLGCSSLHVSDCILYCYPYCICF